MIADEILSKTIKAICSLHSITLIPILFLSYIVYRRGKTITETELAIIMHDLVRSISVDRIHSDESCVYR